MSAGVVSNDQARTQTPSSMLKTYTSPRPQIAKTWGADVWILPPPPDEMCRRCVFAPGGGEGGGMTSASGGKTGV